MKRAADECGAEYQAAWRRAIHATDRPDRNALDELQALSAVLIHAGDFAGAGKLASYRLPYECVRKVDAPESEADARARRIAELHAEIEQIRQLQREAAAE